MIILLFFLLPLLFPNITYAHDASLTYTSVNVQNKNIIVTLTAPYKNILGLYPNNETEIDDITPQSFFELFKKGFVIKNNGVKCDPALKNAKNVTDIKGVIYTFQFTCTKPLDKLQFIYNLFFPISETHENITDFTIGNYKREFIFSKIHPFFDLNYKELNDQMNYFGIFVTVINFIKIGVSHILSGYDHILFLLGMLIISKKFRSILKIVTSFTIAHSITLTVAALGIFLLPSKVTESMIALSIAYIAFENIKLIRAGKKVNKRWLIAFLFGLVHGFGFSTALREIGLPKDNLAYALFSFNLGVEIGQIFIIASIFPILWYIRKQKWEMKFVLISSFCIGFVGLYWFLQRLFLT